MRAANDDDDSFTWAEVRAGQWMDRWIDAEGLNGRNETKGLTGLAGSVYGPWPENGFRRFLGRLLVREEYPQGSSKQCHLSPF